MWHTLHAPVDHIRARSGFASLPVSLTRSSACPPGRLPVPMWRQHPHSHSRLRSHSILSALLAMLVLLACTPSNNGSGGGRVGSVGMADAALVYSNLSRHMRDVVKGSVVASRQDIAELVRLVAEPYGYYENSFDVGAELPLAFIGVDALNGAVLLAAYVSTPSSVEQAHRAVLLIVPSLDQLHAWTLIGAVSISDDIAAPLFVDDQYGGEAASFAVIFKELIVGLRTQRH